MERTVTINGREMRMRASALIPRLYRRFFCRDIVTDMRQLQKAYEKAKASEDEQFSALDLTIFENVAWIMLKHGGEDVGISPDAWLDSIEGVFSVYEIMPVVLELWQYNGITTATPKKP